MARSKKKSETKSAAAEKVIVKDIEVNAPEVVAPEVVESKEDCCASAIAAAKFLVSQIDGINLGGPGQRAFDALKAELAKV